MKIVDLKTFVVGNPWKNWVFIKLYTDEGLTGLGEATGGLSTKPWVGDVDELRRHVIGEDPLHPDRLALKLIKARHLSNSKGISAIEQASWDILGKSLNAPLWQIFGGKHHETLRVYANGWYRGSATPPTLPKARADGRQGLYRFKFDPFGEAYQQITKEERRPGNRDRSSRTPGRGAQRGHPDRGARPFLPSGPAAAGAWRSSSPMWIETPVRSYDLAGHIEVARSITRPVVLGEAFGGRQFADLLAHRVIDIVQPEAQTLGPSGARQWRSPRLTTLSSPVTRRKAPSAPP